MRKLIIVLLLPFFFGTCFADTLTVYPDAGSGTGYVDGSVVRNLGDAGATSWGTIRAAVGINPYATNTEDRCFAYKSGVNGNYTDLERGILNFNTSSIASGATVSAATMSLRGTAKSDVLTTGGIIVLSFAGNSFNFVDTANFKEIYDTYPSYEAYMSYSSFITTGYNDFPFNNPTTAIKKGNGTKIGVVLYYDYSGTTPSGANGSSSVYYWYSADTTGTSSDPKLVVTYVNPVLDGGIIGQTPQNMYSLNMFYTYTIHIIASIFNTNAYAQQ